jgi:methylmalonyl-CoA mutase C-terminal domain/subunit
MNDVLLFAGGIIPDKDIPVLERMGVQKVFQPGARTDDIVNFLRERLSSGGRADV